jgi:large repetitive protein
VAGSYTLNVAAPTITVLPTVLPNASAGTAYSASLTASGAVAPYTFTLTGGALPAGLALSSGGQISGTPTASGSFPLVVTVRDANAQSSVVTFTLNVDVPALTISPSTLPNAVQGVAYSQVLTVSGGIASYQFTIGAGALPAGLSLDPVRGLISGTPTGSGTVNFAVTVTDSTGGTPASATIAYSLEIIARPDPARDPEVRGLTQAQVLASRRFADTQVSNFMRRLESMHGNARSAGGFQNGVRLTSSNYCEDTVTSWTSDLCRETQAQPGLRAQNGSSVNETALGAGTGSAPAERPWTVWTGGTIRFGERDAATGIAGQDFQSEGLSLGADYRFSPSFAAGVGIGFGRDTVDVGENQSRSSGEATTVAVYGSHQLGAGLFIDWLGGYQWLDFDIRRYVTSTGALVNSNRSGSQWFATGSAGADIATGNWQITPYARVDVRRGTLNGYTENSGSLFDLRFLDQQVDLTSMGLGTVVNYQHRFRRATLLPRLRIEYLSDIERSGEARVAYADLISGPFSVIPLTGISREQLTLGLGTEVVFGEALSLELEYLGRIAAGSGTDQTVQAGLSLKF